MNVSLTYIVLFVLLMEGISLLIAYITLFYLSDKISDKAIERLILKTNGSGTESKNNTDIKNNKENKSNKRIKVTALKIVI